MALAINLLFVLFLMSVTSQDTSKDSPKDCNASKPKESDKNCDDIDKRDEQSSDSETECNTVCYLLYDPVEDPYGNTYSNRCFMGVARCIECECDKERKSEECLEIYEPVCGRTSLGNNQTEGNLCTFCQSRRELKKEGVNLYYLRGGVVCHL